MLHYRLLSQNDFNSLYACFLAAFSDYEVDMRMSHEEFRLRLMRDGVRLEMSAGAFDGERMIGFCINGIDEWREKTTAYDAGTGVIPAYRGRGVAKELFAFLEVKLKETGVAQYLLEVLTSNVPAATLYRKLGFVDTRRLAVFRSASPPGERPAGHSNIAVRAIERPDWQLFQTFWDGYPSWQNSIGAVDRVSNERKIIGAFAYEECVGYGVILVPSANLMKMKLDLHTHFYTEEFFQTIRDLPSEFSFDTSSSGQTIITYRGARFFGVTPAMTDVSKRLEDMDRVGIDVEVVSLSTPNVFFTDAQHQPAVARMINDSYAELIANHPKRFKGFASIPMDAPDAALAELHRAIDELKLNGVILLSNIGGKPLTSAEYRPFFEEANRMKLCIFLHPMLPAQSDAFREYVLGPIIGFPFDTSLAVARMCYDGMFAEFPDIRWIIGHLGGAVPYLMERMDNGFRDFRRKFSCNFCRTHVF
jgi:aminocarboxymuconate-semialdehyde decarboxylase